MGNKLCLYTAYYMVDGINERSKDRKYIAASSESRGGDDVPESNEKGKKKLVQDEKSESGQVSRYVYLSYAKALGAISSVIIISSFIAFNVVSALANVWLVRWTEDPILKNVTFTEDVYERQNYFYLSVYGVLGLLQAVFVLLYSTIFCVQQVKASAHLHNKMLSNILRNPMLFFDTTPIGRIVQRFSRDVETIDNNLPNIFRQFFSAFFNVISTVIVISMTTPLFLAAMLPLLVIYYTVQRFYIPTSRQLKRIEATTRSPIFNHFQESLLGTSSIRAYDVAERFTQESDDRVDNNLVFHFAGIASDRWLAVRLEFLGNLIVVAAALFSVIGRNTLNGGLVGLSVSYALQVTGALNWAVRMSSDLESSIVSVERVKEYSHTIPEAAWDIPERKPPNTWPDRGHIEFYEYSTRYRAGLDLVLRGISCQFKAGEKVGIVGRTGAGKSSLTVGLFRLIEASSGSITIDGRVIADLGLHDLRSRLTILPQDPFLFSGTLRKNIDPVSCYTDEQIWNALEVAHLKSFVWGLQQRLNYECGEGGVNLSVGQRQLICLSRTLLHKTRILILDEATAAVDIETDDLIQQAIRSEFSDCTVITIAHRLNTIMDYDRVMVLDQGQIMEFDTPNNLLNDERSHFHSMAKDAGLVYKPIESIA